MNSNLLLTIKAIPALPIVHGLIGILFLSSAAAKGLSGISPSSGMSMLIANDYLHPILVATEMLLGILLLSNAFPRQMHFVATAFFVFLVGASVWMVAVGVSDCGCFGRLPMNPQRTLTIDFIGLALLLFCWPLLPKRKMRSGERLVTFLRSAVVGSAVFAAVLVSASAVTGLSINGLRSRLVGQDVGAYPSRLGVGSIVQGDGADVKFLIHNYSERDAYLIGGTNGCDAEAICEFPILIPAKGQVAVELHHKARGTKGILSSQYAFYVDNGSLVTLPVFIHGRIE